MKHLVKTVAMGLLCPAAQIMCLLMAATSFNAMNTKVGIEAVGNFVAMLIGGAAFLTITYLVGDAMRELIASSESNRRSVQ